MYAHTHTYISLYICTYMYIIYICIWRFLVCYGSQKGRSQLLAFICISLYKQLICNLPVLTKIMSRNKRETATYMYIYIYIYMSFSKLCPHSSQIAFQFKHICKLPPYVQRNLKDHPLINIVPQSIGGDRDMAYSNIL